MDKVIIDGVDVSECDYCLNNKLKGKGHAPAKSMPYAKETSCIECKTNSTRYNFCKHNPNCYYKQLKRLQAENKELKKGNCENCDFQKQYFAETKNLLDENKKLRNKICKERAETREDFKKIIKALQEIRDIILSPEIIDEETKKLHTSEELDNIVRWHREDKLSKIKDKINSVIGAEE